MIEQLQLRDHIATHLSNPEWRRCAIHQIEIMKSRIKAAQEELKLWEDELAKSDAALQ